MRIEITNLPSCEPILLDEFKDHLRLTGSDEDAALGSHITAARSLIEEYAGIALISRQLHLYLDTWPFAKASASGRRRSGIREDVVTELGVPGSAISIPVRPVVSVEAIAILAGTGMETMWPAENYLLSPGLSPHLILQRGRRWPVPSFAAGGIKISLTAGFGPDWNHIPATLRQAVLMVASYLYANRGDSAPGGDANILVAAGVDSLLIPYRARRL